MKRQLICTLAILLSSLGLVGQTQDELPLKLRVASYNVGHFNQGVAGGLEVRGEAVYGEEGKMRYAEMELIDWREWIGEQSIDFLGVQEWNEYFDQDGVFHAQEELLDPFYNNVYFGDQHKWIFNGIATNYKLTNLRQKYWGGDYYALIGDLKVGKKIITVMSLHIPWQKQWHTKALDIFLEEIKKYEYVICMGDFNATDQEQMRFREEGFNMANGGYQGWFSTAAGSLKLHGRAGAVDKNIDNIVTSSNIKIMNVSVPQTGLNDYDHLPVIADLIITW